MIIIAERKLIIRVLKSWSFVNTTPRNPNGINIRIFPKTLIKIVFQRMVSLTKLKVEIIGKSLTILILY